MNRLPPFQVLLDAHASEVQRFLAAMVGPQEAEDCAQETFLAALRAYPDLRDATNLRGWLFTIARRKALDAHRGRVRRPEPVAEPPDGSVTPAEDAGDDGLWRAVAALPDKQRAAVGYRFGGDLAYEDIARLLECSPDAARRSVHEGLRKLRERWTLTPTA